VVKSKNCNENWKSTFSAIRNSKLECFEAEILIRNQNSRQNSNYWSIFLFQNINLIKNEILD